MRVDYVVLSRSPSVNVNALIPPPNSAFDQLYGRYVNVRNTVRARHWLMSFLFLCLTRQADVFHINRAHYTSSNRVHRTISFALPCKVPGVSRTVRELAHATRSLTLTLDNLPINVSPDVYFDSSYLTYSK